MAAGEILVVEDDHDIAHSLGMLLEEEGYHVVLVGHGLEALERLRNSPPPLAVLLDAMLPVMNAWQFREEQLRDPVLARVPVVLMTASPHAARDARALGVDAWVAKPFDVQALLAALGDVQARGPGTFAAKRE